MATRNRAMLRTVVTRPASLKAALSLLAFLLGQGVPAVVTGVTEGTSVAPGVAPPAALAPVAVTLLAVPQPDLSTTEGPVRPRLEHAWEDLQATIADGRVDTPARAEAFGKTGMLYQAHLILDPAEPCYRNAALLAPADHRWPYYLGYLYQAKGRFAEAAGAYEHALGLRPDLAPAHLRLGQAYLELGRLQEAEPPLLAARADPSLAGAAAFALGRLAYARQDYPQAQGWLEEALRASPDATRVHYTLGLVYRAAGDLDQARDHLARRGDVDPPVPDPLVEAMTALSTGQRMVFHEAMEAVYKGEYLEAARLFRDGLALDPANANARVSLARVLYLGGEREAARTELERVMAAAPDHPLAGLLLGALDEEAGAPELAALRYEAVLAAAPDHPGAHYRLANLLLGRGDPQSAAEHYAASLREEPDNPSARLRLAVALVQARAPMALALPPGSTSALFRGYPSHSPY